MRNGLLTILPGNYAVVVMPPILGLMTYKAIDLSTPGWFALLAVGTGNVQDLIAQGQSGMLPAQNPGFAITPGTAVLGTIGAAAAYAATSPSVGAAFVSIGQQITRAIANMVAQNQFNAAEAASGGMF